MSTIMFFTAAKKKKKCGTIVKARQSIVETERRMVAHKGINMRGETAENIRLSERKAAMDHCGDVCETLTILRNS